MVSYLRNQFPILPYFSAWNPNPYLNLNLGYICQICLSALVLILTPSNMRIFWKFCLIDKNVNKFCLKYCFLAESSSGGIQQIWSCLYNLRNPLLPVFQGSMELPVSNYEAVSVSRTLHSSHLYWFPSYNGGQMFWN